MTSTSSTSASPTLHLVCGKIASGKSTLTARLASAPQTVRISEDSLLAQLYPGQIASLADYLACARPSRHWPCSCCARACPSCSISLRIRRPAVPGCANCSSRRACRTCCITSTCRTRNARHACASAMQAGCIRSPPAMLILTPSRATSCRPLLRKVFASFKLAVNPCRRPGGSSLCNFDQDAFFDMSSFRLILCMSHNKKQDSIP